MCTPKNVMKNAEHLKLSFLTKHLSSSKHLKMSHVITKKVEFFVRCCPIDDFLPKKLLPLECYFPSMRVETFPKLDFDLWNGKKLVRQSISRLVFVLIT